MRLHRFYISEMIGTRTEIVVDSAELAHQISHVFRLKSGDEVVLFDGSSSDYICRIEQVRKDSLDFSVISVSPSRFVAKREVYLCASIVKKDTFEWIVEKATELGVTHIIPVMAERSEKKSLNEARLKKIAIEASEQSGRGNVPVMEKIMTLDEALSFVNAKNSIRNTDAGISSIRSVAFHTEGQTFSRNDLPASTEGIAIFIGPEGGWSPDEVVVFHSHKIPLLSLGTQVLRAETAVVASLAVVLL